MIEALARLASSNEAAPLISKIVVANWPRGKYGHSELSLPSGVEVINIQSIQDEAFVKAVYTTDVLVCSLYEHVAESREATDILVDAVKEDDEANRVLIAVSNVLSWGTTVVDEGEVLCEEDWNRRKAHVNHAELLELEKRICRVGTSQLRTHVINAGICYGHEEPAFVTAFEDAWCGRAVRIPAVAAGAANKLPCIHVEDLVQTVIEMLAPPEQLQTIQHVLAVDYAGSHTLHDVLNQVSVRLGTTEVTPMSEDSTFMLKSQDQLQLDLAMEPASINVLLNGKWKCREGFNSNIDKMIQEFEISRGLAPTKLVVGGPPKSGKTRMAEELARYYDVPYIAMQALVRELCGMQEEWNKYEEAVLAEVPDEVLRKMLHIKLQEHSCKWHGWVLDSMQMTNIQLQNLFCDAPPDTEAEGYEPPAEGEPPVVLQMLPRYAPTGVIWVTMDDDDLKERFKTEAGLEMEEAEVEVKLEAYCLQLEEYRALEAAANGEEPAADAAPAKGKKDKGKGEAPTEPAKLGKELFVKYLEKEKIACMKPAEWPDTSMGVRAAIGVPQNIEGPGSLLSDEWVPPMEQVVVVPEPLGVPPEIAAIRARKAEAVVQQAHLQEVDVNTALFEMAQPLRLKLLESVMPTVTEGLIKVCEEQPGDPIDFLQRFLLQREELVNQQSNNREGEFKSFI